MATVPRVATALQRVLGPTAEVAARTSGFIQRQRQLTGASFVQGLVFGWLAHPMATYDQLAQAVTRAGTPITPQGLEQRFTKTAATCLHQVLTAMVETVVSTQTPAASLLRRFTGVWLLDTTIVPLPADLADEWPGSGRAEGTAGIKVHTCLDVRGGGMQGLVVGPARPHDKRSPLHTRIPPKGTLRLTDLGFYALSVLRQIGEAHAFWLCRAQVQTTVFTADGQGWSLVDLLKAQRRKPVVELPVELGVTERLPARLIAFRLDPQAAARRRRKVRYIARRKHRAPSPERLALCSWDVFVTNVPAEQLTAEEVRVLGRTRWQIELLFKLWKSEGHLERSRSGKSYRILCEFYAKLIGLVLQQWCLVLGCWDDLERSWTKAGRVVREYALLLARALPHPRRLCQVLRDLMADIQISCRVNRRKRKPNHCQLIHIPAHASLP
jgi:Transposase DDE domain